MNALLISLLEDLDVTGLKYVHNYLLHNGHDSTLLFLTDFASIDEGGLRSIIGFVEKINPELIGVSLMSHEYFNACSLTKHLKKNFNGIPVIWGGIHPTSCPRMCLDHADYVCVGEGEEAMLDIANALEAGRDLKGTKNLCYLKDGRMVQNSLYPYIDDLDKVPTGGQIPLNSHILHRGAIQVLDRKLLEMMDKCHGRMYCTVSSRGCPFSCTFCCNSYLRHLYKEVRIRRRSVENIMQELEATLKENPSIEYIDFQDDSFLSCSHDYLKTFCEEYKKRVNRPFVIRAIPPLVDGEKIGLLKSAGLGWIAMGLQTGSDRVNLEVYGRRSLRSDFINAANIIKEHEISAIYYVILDNPFENESETIETVKALMDTPKPFYLDILSLTFYYGTELYERATLECPERISDPLKKDMLLYQKTTINNLVRLAAYLDKRSMEFLLDLYEQEGGGSFKFRAMLLIANILTSFIIEPWTYLKLVRLSHRGSLARTLRSLPVYTKEGVKRYTYNFKKRIVPKKSALGR